MGEPTDEGRRTTAGELAELCAAALDLDSADAAALLARLGEPPATRETVRLVAPDATGLALASVDRREPAVGYLDLLAVRPEARRRGVARRLVARAEAALAERGVGDVRWAGHPPCYAWPGVDVRYTPAICCAEALGYQRYNLAYNMTVALSGADLDAATGEKRLAATGVEVRRAVPADLPDLIDWVRRTWGDNWAWEAAESVARPGAGCHVAYRAGAPVGFAGYAANRPAWFGPTGTDPSARRLGIGGVLLRRCLVDLRAAGYPEAQISWVGPVRFYASAVGARIERVFALYRRNLTAGT